MSSFFVKGTVICDSTYIASAPLGVVTVGSRWNETDQNFDVFIRNELENRNNLNIYGTFAPRNNHIDAIAQLDSMRVDYLQPLLTDVFSTLNGRVSGSLDISGPPSRLKIKSSDTRLDEGLFRIAYTNVPYHINGPFHIDHTGVYFDDISIKDDYTGTGSLTGSINWDHFKNMRFNTHISINEIEGINLDEEQSEDFYGRVFGTGNIHITGPMNSILLNVDAVTAKDGRLNIPLDNAATAGKVTNILSFKEEETFVRIDPYETMMIQIDESEKSAEEFTVNLKLNAQPEVEVYVELDKASGNVISARGNGLIDLVVRDEDFSINGDYIISSGNCKFAAMGIHSVFARAIMEQQMLMENAGLGGEGLDPEIHFGDKILGGFGTNGGCALTAEDDLARFPDDGQDILQNRQLHGLTPDRKSSFLCPDRPGHSQRMRTAGHS